MLGSSRGQFQSRFGFVMAAAGSAVGLGNIWGFPTQTASNGGAAFVAVYLVLAFCLAYPILLAEFTLGRHGHSNPIDSLLSVSKRPFARALSWLAGSWGVLAVSSILAFYAVVGGWIIAHIAAVFASIAGLEEVNEWLLTFGSARNFVFMLMFMLMTAWVVHSGIKDGIERLCSRLMPTLFVMMLILIAYVSTLEGASDGMRAFLVPRTEHIQPSLILDAMGQAFFSLSLGVGTMLVYASYLPDDSELPKLAALDTLSDVGVAVLAGLLIMPTMYVAMHQGVTIFDDAGQLISGDTLVFRVLPSLFDSLGTVGIVVALVFFLLLLFAALTSSVSMLEVSVATLVEKTSLNRSKASAIAGIGIGGLSSLLVFDFEHLFGLVVMLTTQYSQPLIGLLFCVFVGWLWNRNALLKEISNGDDAVASSLFMKIWPVYVGVVCPLVILLIVWQSIS